MSDRQAYSDPTPAEAIGNVEKERRRQRKRSHIGCFALRNSRCSVLNIEKCKGIKCSFYKTEEQIQQERKIAFKRMKSLDKSTQLHIAESYYGNKMPWLKEEI